MLFGIVGIYEFAYLNGLTGLYPPFFGDWKDKRDEKTAEVMMKTYYENDKEFIQQFEQERFGSILQMLKIDEKQYQRLSYDLLRARAMTTNNLGELKVKAAQIAFNQSFIEDLTKSDKKDDRVYDNVNYYINLYTAVYDERIRTELGSIMTSFILASLGEDCGTIDYIVIPQESNLLIGLEVGKRLGRPIISIQSKPRIYKSECWDGEYVFHARQDDKKNRIIVLHDILVTGKRILDAVNKLPKNTFEITGMFFLAKYEHSGYSPEMSIVNNLSIDNNKIFCLLTTSEDELKAILKMNI